MGPIESGVLYQGRRQGAEDLIEQALGGKEGITRYGSCILPMDETLCLCALDLSGRPYLNFDLKFTTDRVGEYDTEMVREFFYAIAYSAKMNLHLSYPV